MFDISVIIPAYNRIDTLPYCLASILAQTYSPLEIIIIDDASSDSTGSLLEMFDYQRVRLIRHTERLGAQHARNTGVKHAKGSWIAFLDSDDEWLPEKLQQQIDVLQRSKKLICCCDGFQKNQSLLSLGLLDDLKTETVFSQLLEKSSLMYQGLLVHRDCLRAINGLDNEVPAHQEWDTMIRLAELFDFSLLKDPLFVYHLHGGPSITKDILRRADGYAYVVEKHYWKILESGGANLLNKHLLNISKEYLRAGSIELSIKYESMTLEGKILNI